MKRAAKMLSLGLIFIGSLAMANDQHYFRVEILGSNDDGTEVNVKLPLTMIEAFEPTIVEALTEIKYETNGFNIREIWQAVKDAGPNDYLEIQEGNDTIFVSTTETHIIVRAEGDLEENIHVSVPFELCDALFTDPESFDITHIVEILEGLAGQDLVNIRSDNESIRVWIE